MVSALEPLSSPSESLQNDLLPVPEPGRENSRGDDAMVLSCPYNKGMLESLDCDWPLPAPEKGRYMLGLVNMAVVSK